MTLELNSKFVTYLYDANCVPLAIYHQELLVKPTSTTCKWNTTSIVSSFIHAEEKIERHCCCLELAPPPSRAATDLGE
jgi:hypothetical protein